MAQDTYDTSAGWEMKGSSRTGSQVQLPKHDYLSLKEKRTSRPIEDLEAESFDSLEMHHTGRDAGQDRSFSSNDKSSQP